MKNKSLFMGHLNNGILSFSEYQILYKESIRLRVIELTFFYTCYLKKLNEKR